MILIIDCFKLIKGEGKSIGIYNLALNLVRALVEERDCSDNEIIKGCKIVVLGNIFNKADFSIRGTEFYTVNYNPRNKLVCVAWELLLVTKYCKMLHADKVIFPRGFSALSHGIEDIIIVHDLIPFYYKENFPNYFNKFENIYIMRRLKDSIKSSKKVVTISESSRDDIVRITKRKKASITVINNGYNRISYDGDKIDLNYIIAVTSHLPHKNAEGIINSYVEYIQVSEKPLPLYIIGIENTDEYNLSEDVKKMITCFKYIEKDDQLHQLISNATVFLFLSLIEGFGFPPIEAMQLGVPVICSDLSSLPEVVGKAALKVNPENYTEVARNLESLINDENRKKSMVLDGYENIKRFSWSISSKQYWDVIISE